MKSLMRLLYLLMRVFYSQSRILNHSLRACFLNRIWALRTVGLPCKIVCRFPLIVQCALFWRNCVMQHFLFRAIWGSCIFILSSIWGTIALFRMFFWMKRQFLSKLWGWLCHASNWQNRHLLFWCVKRGRTRLPRFILLLVLLQFGSRVH